MAELADAVDSKSTAPERLVGSTPTPGTILRAARFGWRGGGTLFPKQRRIGRRLGAALEGSGLLPATQAAAGFGRKVKYAPASSTV